MNKENVQSALDRSEVVYLNAEKYLLGDEILVSFEGIRGGALDDREPRFGLSAIQYQLSSLFEQAEELA